MVHRLVRMAAIAAVPLALALTPVSTAASAPAATIHIVNQANLQPDGSISLTVVYSCTPSAFGPGFVSAFVQQPVGVSGSGSLFPATCDDKSHHATLIVSPGPFHQGSATAQAFVEGAAFAQTQAEVKVR
jgi:hypothetical protein